MAGNTQIIEYILIMKNSTILQKARLFSCLLVVLHGPVQAGEITTTAGIASAHPLATKAGMKILRQGGNAFDAAIAITSTLAVVEPYSSGLGGGGFWLLYQKKTNKYIMIDGREKAPLAATRDMYLDKKGNVEPGKSMQGALASGIPGVPAAMVYLARHYGRFTLNKNLAHAVNYARHGYRINKTYRLYAKLRLKALRKNREAARIFLNNNEVPPEGYILKQPDLAKTLENISKNGINGFYSGKTAKALVNGVTRAQGIWSMQDLAQYQIVERKPVIFKYHNNRIISASPPSSGGIALAETLGILEAYNLGKIDKPAKIHLVTESMRRAYADRARFMGDPDFISIPTQWLLGKKHIASWRNSIRLDEATPSEFISDVRETGIKGLDTTHFSIIDKFGNMVSATLSINYPFGACFVPPGTGVLLNDEMDDFSSKPGVPNIYGLVGAEANSIAGGKRPLSSMSPTFIENKDRIAVIGTPGGSRIISMVLLGILEFADGKTAKEIVGKRRYHHQYLPDFIMYEENALNKNEASRLRELGHTLKQKMSPYGGGLGVYGNMQIVILNRKDGSITAASDPRGLGLSIVK